MLLKGRYIAHINISQMAEIPTSEYIILDTVAPVPLPKIYATRLKSNSPTSSHTSAPIITKIYAKILVIFIKFPR